MSPKKNGKLNVSFLSCEVGVGKEGSLKRKKKWDLRGRAPPPSQKLNVFRRKRSQYFSTDTHSGSKSHVVPQ